MNQKIELLECFFSRFPGRIPFVVILERAPKRANEFRPKRKHPLRIFLDKKKDEIVLSFFSLVSNGSTGISSFSCTVGTSSFLLELCFLEKKRTRTKGMHWMDNAPSASLVPSTMKTVKNAHISSLKVQFAPPQHRYPRSKDAYTLSFPAKGT